jgi:hypothetical protein
MDVLGRALFRYPDAGALETEHGWVVRCAGESASCRAVCVSPTTPRPGLRCA